jgi:hypothetical protein
MVARQERTLFQILGGAADAGVRFRDLRSLLGWLGFEERVRGDHHIFTRAGVEEIVNLQPRGDLAKPYQVRQVRKLILQYRLARHGKL